MKGLGKTPSKYNQEGHAVGIHKWTEKKATPKELERWRKQKDYGICLQTRTVRALDIDVGDDKLSLEISRYINQLYDLPLRFRKNSGKCLLAFTMPGDFSKRILPVEGGMVEFLATGQQFIAAGTHPTGERYEWFGGLPKEFPAISPVQFERLWEGLVKKFGTGKAVELSARRERNNHLEITDETVDALYEKGLVLEDGKDGQLFIHCPFELEHSGDSGETETAYFPKGTRGYEQGHFKCLHAHCAGRKDSEFMDALGIRAGDFEDLSKMQALPAPTAVKGEVIAAVATPVAPKLHPRFVRDSEGRPEAILFNVSQALTDPDYCEAHIGFDVFRDEIMIQPHTATDQWRALTDNDQTRMRRRLEMKAFKPIGRELMRDVTALIAEEKEFDSAITWLKSLEWDGVKRIHNFCHDYLGADDTEYTRAVGLYAWSAMAGRVLQPGCQADMAPILQGPQGVGKSSAIAALAPQREFFTEMSFAEKDDDLARKLRGKLVCEIGELRGLHTKEVEAIKSFIVKRYEHWVPKFKEFTHIMPRRCVFFGTTNKDEFLADETGNRRWLPFKVTRQTDVQAIIDDNPQLWAEARDYFLAHGIAYQNAERLAAAEHDQFMMYDEWEGLISEWLTNADDELDGACPADKDHLAMVDVFTQALGIDAKFIKQPDQWRVGKILKKLGYKNKPIRGIGGKLSKAWVKQ